MTTEQLRIFEKFSIGFVLVSSFFVFSVSLFANDSPAQFFQSDLEWVRGAKANLIGKKFLINEAKLRDLESLPGIGPVMAKRIYDQKQKMGPLKNLQDFLGVPGIGPKRAKAILPFISFSDRVLKKSNH